MAYSVLQYNISFWCQTQGLLRFVQLVTSHHDKRHSKNSRYVAGSHLVSQDTRTEFSFFRLFFLLEPANQSVTYGDAGSEKVGLGRDLHGKGDIKELSCTVIVLSPREKSPTMSDQSQTAANPPASEPVLCKMGCGFFVSR
jgi:hypothetical protein